jgi:hypothetical protein
MDGKLSLIYVPGTVEPPPLAINVFITEFRRDYSPLQSPFFLTVTLSIPIKKSFQLSLQLNLQ